MKFEFTISQTLLIVLSVLGSLLLLTAFIYIFTVGDISKFNSIGY